MFVSVPREFSGLNTVTTLFTLQSVESLFCSFWNREIQYYLYIAYQDINLSILVKVWSKSVEFS